MRMSAPGGSHVTPITSSRARGSHHGCDRAHPHRLRLERGCAAASDFVTDGKLTIATGEPAFYPWVLDDNPASGKGFEAAVAYAVAEELGFEAADVEWVRTNFESAIQPGPKDFDFNIQQFSITEDRREFVDFSTPYYETTQVVVSVAGSKAAEAKSLGDLEDLAIGAATGTTSFTTLEQAVDLSQGAKAFNNNDDAKLALENGQVDAIVLDLPTAFYVSGVELTDGVIVGQLPQVAGADADAFGLLLEKGSPLTERVSKALDTLRENGTLEKLATEWLGGEGEAPLLK